MTHGKILDSSDISASRCGLFNHLRWSAGLNFLFVWTMWTNEPYLHDKSATVAYLLKVAGRQKIMRSLWWTLSPKNLEECFLFFSIPFGVPKISDIDMRGMGWRLMVLVHVCCLYHQLYPGMNAIVTMYNACDIVNLKLVWIIDTRRLQRQKYPQQPLISFKNTVNQNWDEYQKLVTDRYDS